LAFTEDLKELGIEDLLGDFVLTMQQFAQGSFLQRKEKERKGKERKGKERKGKKRKEKDSCKQAEISYIIDRF